MTENHLFINRLVVYLNDGRVAYDELFHKGVNIIRGNNSAGKSTISNFIFYVLGGEFVDFVPEAKECESVFAETEMNGALITIRRDLILEGDKVKTRTPMYFYWGDFEDSRNPPPDKHWQKFGYRTQANIKSFSNVIFDNLDIPQVKADSNITIHQLLRLMYVDQDSPTGSLFLYEQFDSQITRETTSDLLLGIYDDQLYQSRKRLIDANKERDEVRAQLRATRGFYSDALALNPTHLETRIENIQIEISGIENTISQLKIESKETTISVDDFRYYELANKIVKRREIVSELNEQIQQYEFEVTDNVYFITSLEEKKKALNNSVQTRAFLNNFTLEFCPECLSEIKDNAQLRDEHSCKLCKQPLDSTYALTQSRRLSQEIDFQIIESNQIQADLKKELEILLPSLKKEKAILEDLQNQFNQEVKDVNSSRQEEIVSLSTQKGFLDGEILQIRTMLEHAEFYSKLQERADLLSQEIKSLSWSISQAEAKQNALRDAIEHRIKLEALYFLNNDLHRQDAFKDANAFNIDFANNIAFLSSQYERFSASSNFYLKITARFAIFLASLSISEMRYPRFILADNMEDKGIEEERAQNFQRKLIERLKSFNPNDFQVIYTTSYIPPEFDNGPMVVGDYYSVASRTLDPKRYEN
ncbi:hypothetical protein [Pedobacter psychrodurus]|uniref:hypothetical protein n=1 Tax=Pedobacter psychrodurus TaxID=2530456 RepID=UPI00292ED7A8|nr:hypothetical protein [Pedobacter psychrodurus]